jgi:MerR family transcriptional regulator, light-induced transcriptional regulator
MRTDDRSNRSGSSNHLSPRALAAAIGVSESSLKRWTDEGRLQAVRTAGGHRRIPVSEAVRFVRHAGLTVVKPEVLGLTAAGGAGGRAVSREQAGELIFQALADDRYGEARSLIVSLYLEGAPLGWLLDGPVREALARVGELWRHGARGIFLEHRAMETCMRTMVELRQLVPAPRPEAPVAVGGAAAGDVYLLPTSMAALVLAESGFRAWNLGADSPVEAMVAAIEHYRPQLVWQSFSVPPRSAREAVAGLERMVEAAAGGTVVVGGRGASALPLPRHPLLQRMGTMAELGAFGRGVVALSEH